MSERVERSRYREQADCLWYAARNHGFYHVQSDVLSGDAPEYVADLWIAFVESVGVDECDLRDSKPESIRRALRALEDAADRHFLSTS